MGRETPRPSFQVQSFGKKRLCIVHTRWNSDKVEKLVQQVKVSLNGHDVDIRSVPGCYELPIACLKVAQTETYDGIIAVGVLVKGETYHFEYISQSCCQGLMDVQMKCEIPITFGVLTCANDKQVDDRIDINIGSDWGSTALEMTQWK